MHVKYYPATKTQTVGACA